MASFTIAGARDAFAQSPPDAKDTVAVGDFQLRPTFEVRTRAEYRHAPQDLGGVSATAPSVLVNDAWAVQERARLGLGIERGALRGQITLQDARVWGATPPTAQASSPSAFASTGAYETFIEMHTANATPSYLRLGRQAIDWDGGRLVSNADASPTGRVFDAVRGHASYKSLDFEAFAAFVDQARPVGVGFGDVSGPYRGGAQLFGALAKVTPDARFSLALEGFVRPAMGLSTSAGASNFALSRAYGDLYVAALRVAGDGKGWHYEVMGVLELGTIELAPTKTKDRLAYAAAGDVSRTFDGIVGSPTLRLGGAYASGGEDETTYKQFDPLYPDVHGPQGLMNAFAWSNVIEGHAALSVVPAADVRMGLVYHYVRLADVSGDWLNGYLTSIGRLPTATDAELGHEIDASFSFRPWPALELAAGYSMLVLSQGAKEIQLAQGRVAREAGGAVTISPLSHFAYAQATLRLP